MRASSVRARSPEPQKERHRPRDAPFTGARPSPTMDGMNPTETVTSPYLASAYANDRAQLRQRHA